LIFDDIVPEFVFFQNFINNNRNDQNTEKNSISQAQKSTENRSIKSNFERDRLILNSIAMRLTEKEALRYFKDHGHDIQKTTYYKIKKQLREDYKKRTHYIASRGLLEKHQETIDKLETIEYEMWYNYRKEPDPSRQVSILEKIVNLQPYITAAYDNTRIVMEKQTELQKTFTTSKTEVVI